MKYLRIAVLGAMLVQGTQSFAATGSFNLTGSITTENSCDISMADQEFDLGKYHYKNLNADTPTALTLKQKGTSIRIACMRETPLALKFSATGTQPVIDGTYHSMTLGETGTDIKKTIAYADLSGSVPGAHNFVLSGNLVDPLVLPAGLPIMQQSVAIHGHPDSVSEPAHSGITYVNTDGTLAKRKDFTFIVQISPYATPTNSWADSLPDASNLPLAGSFTITAVYL